MKKGVILGLTILMALGLAASLAFAGASSDEGPAWYTSSNDTSVQTTYSNSVASTFNITWNDSSNDGNIDVVLIELNYTGTPTNYTMTNGTYGGDVWNYTAVLSANYGNAQYWKSYANNTTDGADNSTPSWVFTMATKAKDFHLNLTYEGTTSRDTNISGTVDSDKLINTTAWITDTGAGAVTLFCNVSGTALISTTSGTSQTYAGGLRSCTVNSSDTGNINYTDNTTGITYYFSVQEAGGGGGGGTGGVPPPPSGEDGTIDVTEPTAPTPWEMPKIPVETGLIPVIIVILIVVIIIKRRQK